MRRFISPGPAGDDLWINPVILSKYYLGISTSEDIKNELDGLQDLNSAYRLPRHFRGNGAALPRIKRRHKLAITASGPF